MMKARWACIRLALMFLKAAIRMDRGMLEEIRNGTAEQFWAVEIAYTLQPFRKEVESHGKG